MASLSVCVFSNQSPARLAAIVAPLRDVAEEIVVALDDRVPNPDLSPLRDIADITIVAPFSWPLEANLEWLHAQCSGDWVLRLDGDEVPSRALVELLARDEWSQDVTHCYVPRRWLVDGGTSWIEANPWWPDTQLRLIKNDPDLLRFGGNVHESIGVEGPYRILDAPIYHLDLIESDLDTRRTKARSYYRARPELRTHGGLSMGAFYTPELVSPDPPTVPLPPEDHLFVHAAVVEDHSLIQPGSDASRAEQVATYPGKSLSVEVLHVDRRGYAGRHIEILLSATNTGTEPLGPSSTDPVRIGGQWVGRDGTTNIEEARADIQYVLEPGRSETFLLIAKIPESEGEYSLSIGALVEGQHWITRAPEIPFTVVDQPQATLVGGYSRHRHLGDDLIVHSLVESLIDEFPQLSVTLLADDPGAIADRFGVVADHASTRVHKANMGRGCVGVESVDQTIALSNRYVAGDQEIDEFVSSITDVIRRSGVFVVAAAGSLTSAYADDALWPRLIEAEIAHAADVPVVITSAGIGPFESDSQRDAAARLLDLASEIHVRDPLALSAVSELGVDKPPKTMVPDAASGYQGSDAGAAADFLVDNGIPPGRAYLVASARSSDDSRTIGQIARAVKVTTRTLDATAVLLPHCTDRLVDDRSSLAELADLFETDVDYVVLDDIPPDPIAAEIVRHAVISIGSRYHNAVLSVSVGRPTILFCETDYDEQRARGLEAMLGTAVQVISNSAEVAPRQVRSLLKRQTEAIEYPDPHPLIRFIRVRRIMG